MIGKDNYVEKAIEIGVENYPQHLYEFHEDIKAGTNNFTDWSVYDTDEVTRESIDLFFQEVEKLMPVSSPSKKTIKEVKEKKSTFKKVEASKKSKGEEGAKKGKTIKEYASEIKVKSKGVERLSEDRKFIRRFIAMHDKEKTKASIIGFIRSLQKAIIEKLISKKSKYADEIREIQKAMIDYYNTMSEVQLFQIPARKLPRLVAIAGGEEVYKSIGVIKSYIGWKGKKSDEGKLDSFISRIEKMLSTGKIGKEDPYLGKVKDIVKRLKQVKGKFSTVEINKEELNGLQGILNACGCSQHVGEIYYTQGKSLRKCRKKTYSDAGKGACSHNKGLEGLGNAMTAEEIANMQFELLPFTGTWANLFGKPEKNFSLMIHGEPGAGKSTFLLKFTKYLAGLGSVLYVTSEEFGSVTLKDLITKYLNPFPSNVVFAPNLQTVDPGDFDFVIFDSITDAGLKLEDYKQLKADNPDTGFILVLQHTKNGQFKGGKEWEHEAQIVGKIESGTIDIYKNRYGIKNSWYFFDNLKA